jgi:hypothetical protein
MIDALLERVAQIIAHRACCGTEHDPQQGRLHGYCVVCGVPWPCEYVGTPPETRPKPQGGEMSEALKPCPFCGAPGVWKAPWAVGCYVCNVHIPVENWNLRSDLNAAKDAEIERLRKIIRTASKDLIEVERLIQIEHIRHRYAAGTPVSELLREIIAWHEQQKEER